MLPIQSSTSTMHRSIEEKRPMSGCRPLAIGIPKSHFVVPRPRARPSSAPGGERLPTRLRAAISRQSANS